MASPLLTNDGYRVFALDHGGDNCQSDLAQSAAEIRQYVDPVLAATGAAKIDVVGHSLRRTFPRYYLVFLDGAMKVDALIAVGATNHGTTSCGTSGLLQSVPEGRTTADQLFAPQRR